MCARMIYCFSHTVHVHVHTHTHNFMCVRTMYDFSQTYQHVHAQLNV